MKSVIFRPEAARDVVQVFDWYEQQEVGLGLEFRDELGVVIERIRERPQAFPVIEQETRRARLRRFPYSVLFRELADALVVVGMFHARRAPTAWGARS